MLFRSNSTLTSIVRRRLQTQNDLQWTEAEQQFAARIQQTLDTKDGLEALQTVDDVDNTIGKGSTDVGDISWVVPTTGFTTVCWVPGTPAHSWQAVAAGGMTIGEKGMHLAARTLALTAVDLFRSPAVLKQAAAELQQRLGTEKYESLMLPGQKPPLDYRNPPKAGAPATP